MADLVHGRLAGAEIARALGLDPTMVRSITLNFSSNDAATVTVETYVAPADLDGLRMIVAAYDLVPRPPSYEVDVPPLES